MEVGSEMTPVVLGAINVPRQHLGFALWEQQ